jgi:hypothetical protein
MHADTSRESRPGRRAVVVAALTDLRGPATGRVELPLWLYWSSPGHAFDLDDPDMRLWTEDLAAYLDRDTLIALWPELYLPRGVRQAWEEQHPALRAAASAA